MKSSGDSCPAVEFADFQAGAPPPALLRAKHCSVIVVGPSYALTRDRVTPGPADVNIPSRGSLLRESDLPSATGCREGDSQENNSHQHLFKFVFSAGCMQLLSEFDMFKAVCI